MPASSSDLATQVANSSTARAVPTTLTAILASGAAPGTATCNALTGWATATKVHFIIYTTTTAGAKNPDQTDWTGVVSGNTITGLILRGGTNNGYSVGAIVEAAPTAAWADDMYSFAIQDHDSQGRHSKLTDTGGLKTLGITPVASAVNNIVISNAITAAAPTQSVEGTDANIDQKLTGKGTGTVYADGMAPKLYAANQFNYIESGCAWTADSAGTTRNGSMTTGVVWIAGKRLTVAVTTAHVFTASKDTYVDFTDAGNGTATITYTEAVNNAASPALASTFAGTLRNAIIVTGAASIAAASSLNQGESDRVLPIATSVPYSVTDSLGNLIHNMTPLPTIIGYRQRITNKTITATAADTLVDELSAAVILPTGRKAEVEMYAGEFSVTGAGVSCNMRIWDGAVGGTQIGRARQQDQVNSISCSAKSAPQIASLTASSSKTYTGSINTENSGQTATLTAAATQPAYIAVRLV